MHKINHFKYMFCLCSMSLLLFACSNKPEENANIEQSGYSQEYIEKRIKEYEEYERNKSKLFVETICEKLSAEKIVFYNIQNAYLLDKPEFSNGAFVYFNFNNTLTNTSESIKAYIHSIKKTGELDEDNKVNLTGASSFTILIDETMLDELVEKLNDKNNYVSLEYIDYDFYTPIFYLPELLEEEYNNLTSNTLVIEEKEVEDKYNYNIQDIEIDNSIILSNENNSLSFEYHILKQNSETYADLANSFDEAHNMMNFHNSAVNQFRIIRNENNYTFETNDYTTDTINLCRIRPNEDKYDLYIANLNLLDIVSVDPGESIEYTLDETENILIRLFVYDLDGNLFDIVWIN